MTSASMIVINWNGAAFLESCLEALLAQATPGDEILVVDNDSVDHSVELLRRRFPGIQLVCNERNLGYAGGANVGLRMAQGEILILLNPDVQVHPGWLVAIKERLADDRVGVVGCKLYYPGNEIIQHAGGIINLPLATADHYGYRQRDQGGWDQEREVDYVTGAALALRREMLTQVGFFDQGFYPAYYEEVDFCFRVRRAGYRVLYLSEAAATHHEHASIAERSNRYFLFFHRNRLRFVLKHYGPVYFLESFVPAERVWMERGIPKRARHVFTSVYLDTMLAFPALHLEHWLEQWSGTQNGAIGSVSAVLKALGSLRECVWHA